MRDTVWYSLASTTHETVRTDNRRGSARQAIGREESDRKDSRTRSASMTQGVRLAVRKWRHQTSKGARVACNSSSVWG